MPASCHPVFSEHRYMLSPVRLSVTPVHPIQAVVIFRNISTAFGTLGLWPSVDTHKPHLCLTPLPPAGELNTRGVTKYSDFGPIEGYISETLQDGR